MDLKTALESVGFVTEIKDSFPIDDRRYEGWLPVVFRRLAVGFHLIPRSTRLKAVMKRFVYVRLKPLGPLEPSVPFPALERIGSGPGGFKNLYAFGTQPPPPPVHENLRGAAYYRKQEA